MTSPGDRPDLRKPLSVAYGGFFSFFSFFSFAAITSVGPPPTLATRTIAQHSAAPADTMALIERQLAPLVEEFFRKEMAESQIPGGVFLLIENDRIALARGYGFANLERRLPVDPETTIWRVGSNSKTLTAAAVLRLVDQGLVRLNEDVNAYLVSLDVPDTYHAPVTLFHLLTHTAGFDDRLFGQHAARREDWNPLEEYLVQRLPPRILPPGQVISYNDHGTSLAGLVVAEVSGRPFADYVREEIFVPLGMTRSSFEVAELPEHVREDLAVAYRWTGDHHEPYDYDYIITAPAAGLVASAGDMGRFLTALLAGGRLGEARFLGNSLTREMLTVQFRHHPRLRGRAFGFAESDENGVYGLYKDGQATGFTARIFLLPEQKIAFFSAINLSIFGRGGFNRAAGFHRRLTSEVLDRLFPEDTVEDADRGPGGPAPTPPDDFAARAKRFVGDYRPVEGSRHTLEKILLLFQDEIPVRENGDGTLSIGFGRWVEVESRLFQWHEGGPYYRAFVADSAGAITHLFIGPGAFERIPFFASQRFTQRAVVIFALLFLSPFLIYPAAARRRRRNDVASRTPHPGHRLVVIGALLNLAFMAAFIAIFLLTDFQRFFKGVPTTLGVALLLPVLAGLASVSLPYFSASAWWRGRGTLSSRLYFSLMTLALLLFLLFLHYWNLLGWRY